MTNWVSLFARIHATVDGVSSFGVSLELLELRLADINAILKELRAEYDAVLLEDGFSSDNLAEAILLALDCRLLIVQEIENLSRWQDEGGV